MVAYSFKSQFIEPILAGRKIGTIRAIGLRRHARADDVLQLYTGMRTKACRLILITRCAMSSSILMRWKKTPEIFIDGLKLEPRFFDTFAQGDGLSDFEAMAKFWRDTHPNVSVFPGEWIKWTPPGGPVEMGSDLRSHLDSVSAAA